MHEPKQGVSLMVHQGEDDGQTWHRVNHDGRQWVDLRYTLQLESAEFDDVGKREK